jgi:hypothetical protein
VTVSAGDVALFLYYSVSKSLWLLIFIFISFPCATAHACMQCKAAGPAGSIVNHTRLLFSTYSILLALACWRWRSRSRPVVYHGCIIAFKPPYYCFATHASNASLGQSNKMICSLLLACTRREMRDSRPHKLSVSVATSITSRKRQIELFIMRAPSLLCLFHHLLLKKDPSERSNERLLAKIVKFTREATKFVQKQDPSPPLLFS